MEDIEHASNGKPRKRIAALDLGTNSFHAVIVDIFPDGSFRTHDKLKEMVDLAHNGLGQNLSEEAMERGIEALKRIKLLCDHQDVERILAYATSAIREARNGGQFIQRIIDEVKIKAHAISGKMEAELIGHAIQHSIALNGDRVMNMDIGGGSVEFTILDSEKFYFLASRKIGVSRMLSQFLSHDPITRSEVKTLEAYYREHLSDVAEAYARHRTPILVGSSGTMESIAEMIAHQKGLDPNITLNEFEYTAEDFLEFYDEFMKCDREERLEYKGLEEKRADMIVPGMVLVRYIIKKFGFRKIKTSMEALREGMIMRYIKEEMDDLKFMSNFPDPRRRSVFELLRKCNWHENHSRRVTNLALKLFDATEEYHQFGSNERELLEYAGLMHDVGYHISHKKHHKHSLYIIRNADLKGFKDEEIEIMANVARYHRRSTPKKRHKYYHKLDSESKKIIKKLSGILRVADGLDRSHYQNVKDLSIAKNGDKISLTIYVEEDPQLEIWGAMRKKELFEEMTGKELEIEAKSFMEEPTY